MLSNISFVSHARRLCPANIEFIVEVWQAVVHTWAINVIFC